MRCKKARVLISASLDGELSRSQELALERHLSVCAACAQEKAQFSALRDTMAGWTDEEPSERLAQRFAQKLKELGEGALPARPGYRRWLFGTATAGLATALLVLGFLLYTQVQPPVPVPQDSAEPPAVTTAEPPGTVQAEPPDVVAGVAPTQRAEDVRRTRRYPSRLGRLSSRGAAPTRVQDVESAILREVAAAKYTEGEAASTVSDGLGEASLTMNGTIEQVRGTLRMAADLVASQYPMPAGETGEFNGGDI